MIAKEGRYSAACQTNPSISRIARYLLTQDAEFEVQGSLRGGKRECVGLRDSAEVIISVGSDQCDREIDGIVPDKPKLMRPHPMARMAWPYGKIRDRWDSLRIHCEIACQRHTVTLQDASISELVDCERLLAVERVRALPDPIFLFFWCYRVCAHTRS